MPTPQEFLEMSIVNAIDAMDRARTITAKQIRISRELKNRDKTTSGYIMIVKFLIIVS
ncbi:hypothetical protein H6S82_28450 [Planktothrix sp. FACHB-1355]|uniref:Uncharacterized protein n=1 Tax=Aerosakkonema funiforme FACHB-1375 TaxID=2949571 RepID=A0A926VL80_9CYAN|nr:MULTISPECIES: hypothetical protein [Oscillatoriales]MBD2185936.1 hypothetical protein [Aerosakkonema funiforme FACHB-1375]MBD3562744.1 hypothetical protein [Planktothrix sp. FACHB-1355]